MNEPKQQGKHQPGAQEPTQGATAQTNATVVAAEPSNMTQTVPATPQAWAKGFVFGALEFFDADTPQIAQQVSKYVTAEVNKCPKEQFAAFRTEGKKRTERLKQFADMLLNEFAYQTATR